ncbi:MAG: toll/interleukin-1 receptor domain-containing protein [Clostridia bacterium]|nr:toll/interleukin-1 receptor domain-containing protein [Clostridia bacterium]
MARDVFISYHNDAREEALALRSELEKNKISVWMAPDDFRKGFDYASSVPNAIKNCKVFVPILSADSERSVWMPKEIDTAINSEKIIIPYSLKGRDTSDSIDFYLTGIEKSEDLANTVERIRRHVGVNGNFFLKKWLEGGPYKKLNDPEEFLAMNIMTTAAFLFAALVLQLMLSTGSTVLSSSIFAIVFLDLVWYTGGMLVPRIGRTNNKRLIVLASLFVTTLLAVVWAIIEFVLLIVILKNI